MDEFPTLSSKTYDEIRTQIRSGDILLCAGQSVFSSLIQKATNSVWSHVGFILRLDIIDRIMLLESVESIGVRAVPLSSYTRDYNGSGKPYPGRLMLARHKDLVAAKVSNLSRVAVDLLGYPYGTQEIINLTARISMYNLRVSNPPVILNPHQGLICSEYAYECFQSIGIKIQFNPMGFIAPADFARDPNVTPLSFIQTENISQAVESIS